MKKLYLNHKRRGDYDHDEWRTPRYLYDFLNGIFRFTVDACADRRNHLCAKFWTAQGDCRRKDWTGQRVFCNPPFSLARSILPMARKAELAVFILPITAIETQYYRRWQADVVGFPCPRIKFVPPPGAVVKTQSPLLSFVAVYGKMTQMERWKLAFAFFDGRQYMYRRGDTGGVMRLIVH